MKEINLKMKEQNKYEIIKELVDHNGNKDRAALKLSLSKRHINRLIINYKNDGKSAFVHGNRGHIPTKITEDIILLYKTKYYDFNHFKDFLEVNKNIKVSYNFIYKIIIL